MNIATKLRRLGTGQIAGLACSALLLAVAVLTLLLGYSAGLALALVSVVLLYLLLSLAVLQHRFLVAVHSLEETRRDQRRLRQAQQAHNHQDTLEEFTDGLERLEVLQKKILTAVETGRLESAERFNVLDHRAD